MFIIVYIYFCLTGEPDLFLALFLLLVGITTSTSKFSSKDVINVNVPQSRRRLPLPNVEGKLEQQVALVPARH